MRIKIAKRYLPRFKIRYYNKYLMDESFSSCNYELTNCIEWEKSWKEKNE